MLCALLPSSAAPVCPAAGGRLPLLSLQLRANVAISCGTTARQAVVGTSERPALREPAGRWHGLSVNALWRGQSWLWVLALVQGKWIIKGKTISVQI